MGNFSLLSTGEIFSVCRAFSFWLTLFLILFSGRGEADQLVKVPGVSTSGKDIFLSRKAAAAYLDLVEQANKEGFLLKINYGYRSVAEQRRLYLRNLRRCEKLGFDSPYCVPVSKPGRSTHNRGVSIDISNTYRDYGADRVQNFGKRRKEFVKKACVKLGPVYRCRTVLYWWLKRNAPTYGFHNDVSGEYWHWTFMSDR